MMAEEASKGIDHRHQEERHTFGLRGPGPDGEQSSRRAQAMQDR